MELYNNPLGNQTQVFTAISKSTIRYPSEASVVPAYPGIITTDLVPEYKRSIRCLHGWKYDRSGRVAVINNKWIAHFFLRAHALTRENAYNNLRASKQLHSSHQEL